MNLITASATGSNSVYRNGESCPRWWAWAPRVVAESLVALSDPLAGMLVPGPAASPGDVARALAATVAPPRARDAAPEWLDADQADSLRLLLHSIRSHGAALCADPVGSGKTYVALAVARALGAENPACLVPASLVPQWTATARKLGVDIICWSHSRLSLGRLPPGSPSLVIVDESHHFRHPDIRRYRTLAPWLVGRRLLLLSATPVVNRPADLYHQLHLGLRDDVLASEGAPSLRAAFQQGEVPPALGRFVVQRVGPGHAPVGRHREVVASSGAVALLHAIDHLGLATEPEVAALIGGVLVRAAASSASALGAALRRYRLLLLHAQDAKASGRPFNRREIWRLVGAAEEQLLMWSLFPDPANAGDLIFDDLPAVESLLSDLSRLESGADAKSRRLEAILADRVPSLVFVTARETITYLRRVLPDPWLAWCTGRRAGIGTVTLPRSDVLRWFRPDSESALPQIPGRPHTLLTTDVAAEGLDLQGAGRVVHYDLPWTEVRVAQRDGRAVRRGSSRKEVEIIRFLPGQQIESRLHQQAALLRKSVLPARHGIGPEGRRHWRWRRELSDALRGPGVEGVVAVRSSAPGALAGVALEQEGSRVVSVLLCRDALGEWTIEPAEIELRLQEAVRATGFAAPSESIIRQLRASLSPSVRALLREASVARTTGVPSALSAVRLGKRLRTLAAHAARRRDAGCLTALERALAFCTGGHTAGELRLLESLSEMEDGALLATLPSLPEPSPRFSALRARLTGLIVFGEVDCPADPLKHTHACPRPPEA